MKTRAEKQAALELVLMAFIWGYGFVAIVSALDSFTALGIAAYRFWLSFLLVLPFVVFSRRLRKEMNLKNFTLACIPGIFLGLSLFLQTAGLQYTTATKSGFITTLYILWVPMLEQLWLGRKLSRLHYVYVFLGLIGTAMICKFHGGEWNQGDLLTLACSFTLTVQIVSLAKYADQIQSPFVLNGFQSLWAALICSVFLIASRSTGFKGWATIPVAHFVYLAVFSSFIAFTIQVRAQKVLSAGVASMIFLLESPAASFFAYLFLGETLDLTQWIGAQLILAAAILVVKQPSS
ncbi:MAG: DMT family transporter [Xanthomonadaceae bacterium]|nr:DMT family transporter [Xanthomonadaceae bacterium]